MDTDQTTGDSAAVPEIPPPDEAAHLDGLLMSELSTLNYLIGQYVLRHHDADAGRANPVSFDEEEALANSVAAAADSIRARVARRKLQEEERR